MKGLMLIGLLTLVGCGSVEPLESKAPDTAGLQPLPVDDFTLVRKGEHHVLTVKTHTGTAGWELSLVPYEYSRTPAIYTLLLVGKAPAGSPEAKYEQRSITRRLDLKFATKFVAIQGSNSTYKASVPWMSAPSE